MLTNAHAGDFNVMPAYRPLTLPTPTPTPRATQRIQTGSDDAAVAELLAQKDKIQNAVADIQAKQEALLPFGSMNKIVSIAQNPKTFTVMKSIVGLTQGPHASTFYAVEAVWFILIILFRTWKISKAGNAFKSLWIQFYMTIIYIVGGSVLIPFFFFSPEERRLLLSLL